MSDNNEFNEDLYKDIDIDLDKITIEEIIYDEVTIMPTLALRGLVLYPDMMLHFDIGRKKSALAVENAMRSDQKILIVTQKYVEEGDPKPENLYKVGVVAKVVQVLKQPEGVIRVVVEGLNRGRIAKFEKTSPFFSTQVSIIEESDFNEVSDPMTDMALLRTAKKVFEDYAVYSHKLSSDILYKIASITKCGNLADAIMSNITLEYTKKQAILEELNHRKRLKDLITILVEETEILKIEEEINIKTRDNIDENQRMYFLNEQLKVIQEELGQDESPEYEAEKYRNKIIALKLSIETTEVLCKEVDKLSKMPYNSQEANVIRNYLDLCLDLPWNKKTKERIDLQKVRKQLDKNHHGLDKVKTNIIETLAVRKLAPSIKGQILCLVGPPGVGKTSIAQSIATAINRKAQRIALGGVRDESEIRGHRRTYIGAMPGRIINALKLAKTNNPLIILDEIDKLGSDYKGDPTSALLEVLDAEQNNSFHDHYVDIPFDLSNVMFITTANDKSTIPAPLLDRMEVIEVSSYTREEKFNIAKKHIIPKQIKNCGVTAKNFKITDVGIYEIIDNYTREAGVRNLERKVISLIKKAAVEIVENDKVKVTINDKNIENYLGIRRYRRENKSSSDEVGVCTGLAWTSVGGATLPIEVSIVDGTGKIEITGSLGDVMKESAKISVTCARSLAKKYNIDKNFYKDKDIHIHAPEGAVPKDGPSAGITMTTALISALTDSKIKSSVAMTGEITLRGKVLAIGGLKEKSMAAYRYGIDTVLIPYDNKSDLAEIDEVVKEKVKFIPVKSIEEVLSYALVTKKEIKSKDAILEAKLNNKIEVNTVNITAQ